MRRRGGFGFVGWRGGGEWRERGWRWWGTTSTSTAMLGVGAGRGGEGLERGYHVRVPCPRPASTASRGGGALCLCAGAPSQPPLKKNNYRATLRGSWRPAIDGLGEKRQKRGLSGWAGLASGIPAFGWGKLLFSVRTQPPPLLVPPFFFF